MFTQRLTLCIALLAMTAFLLGAADQASAFKRFSTIQGAGGRSATKEVETTKTEDGYDRSKTWTGPQGQTAGSTSSVSRTEDGYTSSTTATGPGGQSATHSGSGKWDSETKTWVKQGSSTGPRGRQGSHTKTTTFSQ